MADIYQDFPIKAPAEHVFQAVSTPQGLDRWWTQRSAGTPTVGSEYELWFGPEYGWRARVTQCVANRVFVLQMTVADPDWMGTTVGFHLEDRAGTTWVRFSHTGWPSANEHYRISCHCWALYLRVLRRCVEHGEDVPYEDRLDV